MTRFIPRDVADDLRAVRDALPLDPASFDMRNWFTGTECGTACCIAGHFAVLRGFVPEPLAVGYETGFARNKNGEAMAALDVFLSACGVERTGPLRTDPRVWLFLSSRWPDSLDMRYKQDPIGSAQQAIDLYLAQHEILAPEPESQPQETEIQEVS